MTETDPMSLNRETRTGVEPSTVNGRDLRLPRKFGRYEIVRRLGAGGMAEVYLANDAQLARQVAIKTPIIHGSDSVEPLRRFLREAKAASKLQHPHICPVYEAGEIDGVHYFSMRFVDGSTLGDWVSQHEPVSVEDGLAIVLKLAGALEHAHRAGIIHRDLKPGNVMMDSNDEPFIMDFGLTRNVDNSQSALTPAGVMLGTPTYMSPEQMMAEDDSIGPAADVYSLGVVMYELITGWLPFSGNLTRLISCIMSESPARLREHVPLLNPDIEEICLRALAKDPVDRFESAGEMGSAIEAFLHSDQLTLLDAAADIQSSPPLPKKAAATDSREKPGIGILRWVDGILRRWRRR